MAAFLYPRGTVYVLENGEAQRVKVGMTDIGVNSIAGRLRDINDMWHHRKVYCQICAGRLVNVRGRVPRHVKSGFSCSGGGHLPLEASVAVAEEHLEHLKVRFGTGERALARRINTLERRIEKYRHYQQPDGEWKFHVAFNTEGVAEVEALAHKMLERHLDRSAPFGEVFSCSASVAAEAIEQALIQLGVAHSVRMIHASGVEPRSRG